jgi:small subunit ribosomal protein S2
MLTHGLHLGHLSRFWNPKMAPYIHKVRYGVHIINLVKTESAFRKALSFIEKVVSKGGKILFVGTKARASDLIAMHANRANMPYVNHRWLGGMLTNFKTVKQSVSRLIKFQEMVEAGTLEKFTKKESLMKSREIEKLEKTLGGIKKLSRLPDALFVIDVGYEDTSIKEANKLGIPVIGLVDTNNSPDGIQYVIPANDDAILSLNYSLSLVSNLIENVRAKQSEQQQADSKQLARNTSAAAAPKRPREKEVKKVVAEPKTVESAVPTPSEVTEPLAEQAKATISAGDVKKLREVTEAAMMDCKKALVQANGDFEKAKEILMQSSQKKVAKASTRVAAEGVIQLIQQEGFAGFIEINCETDFVARDEKFLALQALIEKAIVAIPGSVEELLALTVDGACISDHIAQTTAKLGEKIQVRRMHFEVRDGNALGLYNHGGKIAAFARIKGDSPTIARDLAMQIAAMNPLYLDMKSIPADVMSAQEAVITEEMQEEGEKTAKIKKSIMKGRLDKHFAPLCLMTQAFIKQSELSIEQLLEENKIKLVNYGRFEVGEGIEKNVVDFAEEVMKVVKG